jgi:hypothetical protein
VVAVVKDIVKTALPMEFKALLDDANRCGMKIDKILLGLSGGYGSDSGVFGGAAGQ